MADGRLWGPMRDEMMTWFAAFLEPVELELYWIYAPDATVQPYECTEG